MKQKLSIIGGATLASCLAFGPVGLVCLLAIFLNFQGIPSVLGTSYPILNTQTVAQYVTANSAVQEQLWLTDVLDTNGENYQSTPFAEMTGKVINGKPANDSALQKAVVEITDMTKVRGDTINITSFAGIGGEGAAGSETRNGTGAKVVSGNMTVTIGNQFFSIEYKQSEVDKTMIGQELLKNTRFHQGMKNLHNKRKNDTILWRMLAAAGYGASAFAGTQTANNIYPPGVANRAALKSANTVDLPTIMAAGDVLPGNGAAPMDTTDDSGGSVGELYMFFAADKSLFDFESDPTNNQYLQYGWDRGQNNPIFKGGFIKVRGHGMYRWTHRDHANYDNIGSPLLPRAKLSVATTNADAIDIRGGGVLDGAATDTVPQWFKHFSNGPVKMYGNVANISATTATNRYLMIIGSGGYSQWLYTVNTGNKITTTSKVTSTATTPYVHAVGDVIVECNVLGTVIGRSIMLGAQAVVGGAGSIAGNPAGPAAGVIRRQELDYQNDIGLGLEACGGYAAVKRAGDGAFPGFVVCEHAISPTACPGAPNIT